MGQPYIFTVNVTNADGTTSANSAPLTPETKPAAPVIVATTNGEAQAWIDWSAPSNGGSTITGYTVTRNPAGATCNPGTSTECVVTGLTNDTSYTITVTATNAQGTSDASAPVAVTPSATAGHPGAPTAVSATPAGSQTAQVAFTPATDVAGFPTSFYTASCTPSGGGSSVDDTAVSSPITVTPLTNGTAYTCTVTATNGNGTGPASSASNSVTPQNITVPGTPTIGTATGGATQATVTWTAPSPLPASAITTYQVRYQKDSGTWSSPVTTGSTSTSYTVTGLMAGSYVFQVRAVNAGGAGDWSGSTFPSVTVTSGTLNAPTGVAGTPGTAQVSLTWSAPSGGTLSPTSYQVRYSSNSGSSWTELSATGTTTTTATISGLTNGTAYVFGVRAINGSVTSDWSSNSAAVTPGPPGAPMAVTGTAGNAQVALTWTAPTGTPAATGYQVQYAVNGTTTWLPATPLTATSTSLTVTGLTNGTAYVFRVRAVNGAVTGNYSANSAAVTPRAPVGTITIEGERGTGNDSNRVYVTGVTSNLVGQKVVPYYRFPGQTGFTAGTGERTVDANGQFSWQRKTGKRIVVQFRFGDLRSNNVKIDAR